MTIDSSLEHSKILGVTGLGLNRIGSQWLAVDFFHTWNGNAEKPEASRASVWM